MLQRASSSGESTRERQHGRGCLKAIALAALAARPVLLTANHGALTFHAAAAGHSIACTDPRDIPTLTTPRRFSMKRLALVAAVVLVAACSTQEKPADTAAPAMAPAP